MYVALFAHSTISIPIPAPIPIYPLSFLPHVYKVPSCNLITVNSSAESIFAISFFYSSFSSTIDFISSFKIGTKECLFDPLPNTP
jgi:hypothetical protein